jgi:two-component system CheB/CheR fusion protein
MQRTSVPDEVLSSETDKLSWFQDVRDLSIGELVEKYAYAEAVVETVREPLLILDKNLRVKSANKSFFDTFRVTKKETYDNHIYDLNGGEWNIPELKKLLEEILPQNSHFNDFEVTHNFSRLGKRVMLLNARRIVFEGNKTQLILLSIEDITQKKSMEMQKDEFISNVSHELKTPLTSMKAYVQLAQKRLAHKANKQESSLLEKIDLQTDKLTGLITELLQMSLSESNGDNLQKKKVDLDALIHKVVSDYEESYDNFTFVREGTLNTEVLCDENRMEQVLVNLLTNAVKYSPESSKIIVHADIKNSEAVVGVQDFGTGILKKDQPHIFERYYRSKVKRDKGVQGFGLGLYISANIINLHNGRMWFKSTKGKGSTFYFALPVK